jgi:hypothetical protein
MRADELAWRTIIASRTAPLRRYLFDFREVGRMLNGLRLSVTNRRIP